MEWSKPRTDGDSGVRPVDRIDFDMLRAIASARQASTPTVRAMHMTPVSTSAPAASNGRQTMALLRGEQAATSGAFRTEDCGTVRNDDVGPRASDRSSGNAS